MKVTIAGNVKDIKEGTYTLRTSCLNYAPVTQKVSQSQKEMVIRLKSTSFNMDQVVVPEPELTTS